jgi:hypothetical protein
VTHGELGQGGVGVGARFVAGQIGGLERSRRRLSIGGGLVRADFLFTRLDIDQWRDGVARQFFSYLMVSAVRIGATILNVFVLPRSSLPEPSK